MKYKVEEESEIEKRKKHLQSLRELKPSINHDELVEHSKKIDEIAKEKFEERKKMRMTKLAESYDYSQY